MREVVQGKIDEKIENCMDLILTARLELGLKLAVE
jgi:hypothetical protein